MTDDDTFIVLDRISTHRCTFPGGGSVIPDIPDSALARNCDLGLIIRCSCGQRWIAEPTGIGFWWRKITVLGAWRLRFQQSLTKRNQL